MSAWGNTDNHNQKPKSPAEREVRETLQFQVLTGNTAGNNVIQVSYNDGGLNNVANVGVAGGQYVYFWANGFGVNGGQNGNGVPGMFASNTTVSGISGNTITLSTNLFGNVSNTFGVEFDKAISRPSTKTVEQTYNSDTILVTPTRLANANSQLSLGGAAHVGWNHYQKKVNNDGTVRILQETLVTLANPVASNTTSGSTSFGSVYTGV